MKTITILLITALMFGFLFGNKKDGLETVISCPSSSINIDAEKYELDFTVTNQSSETKKFCTYHTPFEGIRNEILKIKKSGSGRIEYIGVLKKRAEPTEDDYITLAPGESKSTLFDMKKSYDFKGTGKYKVQFRGNKAINGLENSNKLSFSMK